MNGAIRVVIVVAQQSVARGLTAGEGRTKWIINRSGRSNEINVDSKGSESGTFKSIIGSNRDIITAGGGTETTTSRFRRANNSGDGHGIVCVAVESANQLN